MNDKRIAELQASLSASQAREAELREKILELEQRVKVLLKGLNALNYTASENSPNARIVRELLRQTPQQTAAQIERGHVEWMMKLPVAHEVTAYSQTALGLECTVGTKLIAIPPLPKESNSPETDLDESLRRQ